MFHFRKDHRKDQKTWILRALCVLLPAAILLSGCSLIATPELAARYPQTSVPLEKAEKAEWGRTDIGGGFRLVSDFDHRDKDEVKPEEKCFLRLYDEEKLIYEEKNAEPFSVCGALISGDSCYLIYDRFDEGIQGPVTVHVLCVSRTGDHSEFRLDGDFTCFSACLTPSGLAFGLMDRSEMTDLLLETDLSGTVLNRQKSDRALFDMTWRDDALFYSSSENGSVKWYRLNRETGYGTQLGSFTGIRDDLSLASGCTALFHTVDGPQYVFYHYDNGTETELFKLSVPDDLSYTFDRAALVNGKLFVAFSVTRGLAKDLYHKYVILCCDPSDQSVVNCAPDSLLATLIERNGNYYIGSYLNQTDDGTSNGDFARVDLKKIAEAE